LYREPTLEEIQENPGVFLESSLLPAGRAPADESYYLTSLVAEPVDWEPGHTIYPKAVQAREEKRIAAQSRRGAQRVEKDALLNGASEEALQAAMGSDSQL